MTISKSKARIPVQKRSIETKEKILNAAWTLFAEKGYFKTSTHDLAEQAGVATGSFYGYFNNKTGDFIRNDIWDPDFVASLFQPSK